jgi:hypothetical protein
MSLPVQEARALQLNQFQVGGLKGGNMRYIYNRLWSEVSPE